MDSVFPIVEHRLWHIFFFLCLLFQFGCNQSTSISRADNSQLTDGDPRHEEIIQNENGNGINVDSLELVIEEKIRENTPKISSNSQLISIDPQSGAFSEEVEGVEFLKAYSTSSTELRSLITRENLNIYKYNLNEVLEDNTLVIEGLKLDGSFGLDAEKKYRPLFSFSKGEATTFLVGYKHGGILVGIVTTLKGELTNVVKLSADVQTPNFKVSNDGSFFTISSFTNDKFYVYSYTGDLVVNSNYKEYDNSFGTSYGGVYVDNSGGYLLLQNNISRLYHGKENILSTSGYNFLFDEENNRLIYLLNRDTLIIQSIENGSILYEIQGDEIQFLSISNGYVLAQSGITKKMLVYETK